MLILTLGFSNFHVHTCIIIPIFKIQGEKYINIFSINVYFDSKSVLIFQNANLYKLIFKSDNIRCNPFFIK